MPPSSTTSSTRTGGSARVIDGASALRAAQAAFRDAPVPDTLDIAILDRTLPDGELSALRARRTVLVA
jgi:hypothetical protein